MSELAERMRAASLSEFGQDIDKELLDDGWRRIEQLEAALKKIAQEADPRVTRDFFFGSIALRALEDKEIRGLCSGDVPMNERLAPEARAALDEVRSRLESIDRIPHWDALHVQGSLEIVMRAIVALDERITQLEVEKKS